MPIDKPVSSAKTPRFSLVVETPAAVPIRARDHFVNKLAFETDPSDVYTDLQKGNTKFILVDTRNQQAYAKEHIKGAINLPHREISMETTSSIDKDLVLITYCWGPGCNASTKGAAKLAGLGFRVKEMIGGIEYWKREGYPVE